MSYRENLSKNPSDFTHDVMQDFSAFKTNESPQMSDNTGLSVKEPVNFREVNFVPGPSYRMPAEERLSCGQAVPPSVQAPTQLGTNSGQMYAFQPEVVPQSSNSNLGYHNVSMPMLDAPQPGHSYIQSHGSKAVLRAANGDTYQICSPTTSLQQGVMMPGSTSALQSSQQMGVEASRKRELRLIKNREAARESRRKKKDFYKLLENHFSMLENQNKALLNENKILKDTLRTHGHKI